MSGELRIEKLNANHRDSWMRLWGLYLEFYDTNHIVIIHRENKASENFEKYFHVILEKKYGRSKIVFGNFN